jgi:hypothetical protein
MAVQIDHFTLNAVLREKAYKQRYARLVELYSTKRRRLSCEAFAVRVVG